MYDRPTTAGRQCKSSSHSSVFRAVSAGALQPLDFHGLVKSCLIEIAEGLLRARAQNGINKAYITTILQILSIYRSSQHLFCPVEQ